MASRESIQANRTNDDDQAAIIPKKNACRAVMTAPRQVMKIVFEVPSVMRTH
jgi:hypothetical protein